MFSKRVYGKSQLIVAATRLTPSPESGKWLKLARDRLDEQVRVTFSENGVHLEHSPSYHMWITQLIERISRYMAATNCDAGEQLARKLPLAKASRQSLIMPDGTLPAVGDTARNYRWGKPPETAGLLVYPEAGYGIIRSGLTVFIQAGHQSFAHKHCDDLSLLVFTDSGPVITDSGFLNYEPNDPRRHYTTSWPAHSTVTWKSEPLQQQSVLSGIEAYGSVGDYSFIRASSTRPDGYKHVRCVFHDADQELVAIADRCTSPVKVQWQRRFIIAPSVTARLVEAGRATLNTADDEELDMFLWPDNCNRRIVTGQASPMEGWVADAWGDLVPAPVLLEKIDAKEITLAAMIRPAGENNASISIDANGRIIIQVGFRRTTVETSASAVRVERDGRTLTIELKTNKLRNPR